MLPHGVSAQGNTVNGTNAQASFFSAAQRLIMKVPLIYPQSPDSFWSFKHVLRYVSKKSTFPPLGLLTVAAMLPSDWDLRLVDLNVKRLKDRDLRWADYIMLSAMIVHKDSVREIMARCTAMKKTVIAGGPLFTTGHEAFPEIQHFVLGEAEDLMPSLVADMLAGAVRPVYQTQERPDVARTPAPRWDLINLNHYVTMGVQFSRGCPYDCEFCDIVIMNCRVPRTKTPAQLIHELDGLAQRGWRDMVFIVDDNFIGNKKKTKEFLRELIAWRERTHAAMGFLTEASVNLADDAESVRVDGAGGIQEGVSGHRNAVTGGVAGMSQAAEHRPRPAGGGADNPTRGHGGDGGIHRRV